jgi:hypothetical protein
MPDLTTPQPGTEAANPLDASKVESSVTSFGFSSYALPTPKWANAAFDIYLIITTSFLAYIAADNVFGPELTKHIFYFLTLLLTPIVKGVSKMFGVKVDDSKN